MYKTISKSIIKKLDSESELLNVITSNNEELSIKQWVEKYRSVVSPYDIMWILLRNEFISEKELRLFAVWLARETLKLVKNPDIRSIEACNVAERYANGEATTEELNDVAYAAIAARDAAYAANAAAYYAADVAYDAADAAVLTTATDIAAYAVSYAAANAAGYAAVYSAQLEKLLTYF